MFACSGGVWTQTTDVEGEVNGLISYDRRIVRMNETQWKEDVAALYTAAARRGSEMNATEYVVMMNRGVGGLQMGLT
jgi:hypothetical protein